jgi:hypothetical protein
MILFGLCTLFFLCDRIGLLNFLEAFGVQVIDIPIKTLFLESAFLGKPVAQDSHFLKSE